MLFKIPTGIKGLDEITYGGLPQGRTTLVCGGPGCGKSLLAMEFLVRGVTQFGEPGVFIAFEETAGELATNAASLGFDVAAPRRMGSWRSITSASSAARSRSRGSTTSRASSSGSALPSIRLGPSGLRSTPSRCSLPGCPTLASCGPSCAGCFAGSRRRASPRSSPRRRGDTGLTRHGLEEYVSDCVITLDNRVNDQISTRRLRVLKYRGSDHDINEVPFLIGEGGLSVLPISSLKLDHQAPTSRVSSGIPDLDNLLGGGGFYRGSTVLVSGAAGSGKTSTAASFARQACREGKRCLFFTFEESQNQVVRNMRAPSASTWHHCWNKTSSASIRRGPVPVAWRCTWPGCIGSSPSSSPRSLSWIRS